MKYPKVLIVGQYFNIRSGGGITMTNLFKGWDKENIAVAAEDIINPDFSVCNKYYRLGALETKRRFPFNLNRWGKHISSGIIYEKETLVFSTRVVTVAKESGLQKKYLRLLRFSGLYHYKRRHKISPELLSWIREYAPDIIYTQLSSVPLIRLVSDLHETLELPIVIHIMDDWPVSISQNGLLKSYWFKVIDKGFRRLLSKAKVLMSISEAMSTEYLNRYGLNFIPFHNPIDIKHWSVFSKKTYEVDSSFVILYAGRIGIGIQNCFFDIAEAINNLNVKGFKIELHIQATNFNPVLNELSKFNFVKLNPSVSYGELPAILSKSDLLLLPNDFDSKSISFLKFSMPTKASEYMASGTPVLLYSSIETAVTRHALKYNWAYVVSEKDSKKLESAISELFENRELRIKLGDTAKEYAITNYDGVIIREQFRKAFAAKELNKFEDIRGY
jgi:glycosyltransferase involved in cell wall biosynthesis